MNRFYTLIPLVFSLALLSGCPDAKLPSPAPKVPEPKAEKTSALHPALLGSSPVGELPAIAKTA